MHRTWRLRAIFVVILLALAWAASDTGAQCVPKFTVSINLIGGPPPGAPKQWPILIDGRQVGITNTRGSLGVTTSVGRHVFSTYASWTYRGKNYRYAGQIQKNVACNTWSFNIPVNRS